MSSKRQLIQRDHFLYPNHVYIAGSCHHLIIQIMSTSPDYVTNWFPEDVIISEYIHFSANAIMQFF